MTEEQQANEGVDRCALYFESCGGGRRIHALHWRPAGPKVLPVRGIVQIAHGMVEHIGRYDDFARFLASRGYAVCGADHIGHGQSVASAQELGCMPENGAQIMVADVHTLRTIMTSRYPQGTPYFLFGHSMGSFVVRAYLARFGSGLSGAIVCGTGQQPVVASRLGGFLARRIGERKGYSHRSTFMENLAIGGYSKAIAGARTSSDWLNTDPAKVDEYLADTACGMVFSVGGYASLTDLTAEVASPACAAAVPAGLPVLFIAGEQDPVGDCGKGVRAAADAMAAHSRAVVETKLYPGMRHEILNEPEHMVVYEDVYGWLERNRGGEA